LVKIFSEFKYENNLSISSNIYFMFGKSILFAKSQRLNLYFKYSKTRVVFFSLGTGYPEFFNIKLGSQINRNLSVSIKAAVYYDGKGGMMYFGTGFLGIKVSKYFNPILAVINNISLDVGYSKDGPYDNYAFDLSIGNESNDDTFLCLIGLCV
jgi:hypothetical protein